MKNLINNVFEIILILKYLILKISFHNNQKTLNSEGLLMMFNFINKIHQIFIFLQCSYRCFYLCPYLFNVIIS